MSVKVMLNILRTPDDAFTNLPDYPFEPNYIEIDGARMHYVSEGPGDELVLCLHGEPSWSYLYRHMIPPLVDAGHRVIVPDLIGFGKSDKLAEQDDYSFSYLAGTVVKFIQQLDLSNITVVVQDWGGLLGLNAVNEMPERFARLVIMNTGLPTGDVPMPKAFLQWQRISKGMKDMPVGAIIDNGTLSKLSVEVVAGYDAPYPDASYKAAAQILPSLVPTDEAMDGAKQMQATRATLSQWDKPALVMFSDGDPITKGGDAFFRKLIPTAKDQPEIIIEGGGHFLQEDKGPEIAAEINAFIARTR